MAESVAAPPSNSLHGIGKADSVEFYNAFLKRLDDPTNPILVDVPESADSASMMVIDVEDDFILPPPGLPTSVIPAGYTYGRFNVEDGANMTNSLGSFIVGNMDRFSKIIFTRDTHTVDHCSFGTNEGPFPNHCVANHVGAKFHKDMKRQEIMNANGGKVDVIFKGCAATTDSFGAVPYKAGDEYTERRQLGKCNTDGFTGGKYLQDKTRNFEDYPFVGIPEYSQDNEKECPESTTDNIAAELGALFEIKDLFPGQTSGTHNIYVVGVAGDYCVKDTAINIMNTLDSEGKINGVKINVYVLQPFVRYGFLPLQFLGGPNVYKNETVVKRNNYLNTSKKYNKNSTNVDKGQKDINKYVYKLVEGGKKQLLNTAELEENRVYIKDIVQFTGDNFPEAKASNSKVFCSFLSPVKDIVKDYRTAGVKMLLNIPEEFTRPGVEAMDGGRRRRRRKTQRKSKKGRKSRKHRH